MKNSNFAERLRFYRQANQLSVQQVADQLAKDRKPVSVKSIYSWENGQTQPSADTLMYLCELYKINNVLEAFGYENRSEENAIEKSLSPEEAELVLAYRKHPEYKNAVRKLYDLDEY